MHPTHEAKECFRFMEEGPAKKKRRRSFRPVELGGGGGGGGIAELA